MMRFSKGLALSTSVLLGLACSVPARAAGSQIDPDPASPSLSELIERESAANARHAALPAPEVPAAAPVIPAPHPAAPRGAVRQVYPSPYGAPAVTVLVPGRRLD